MKKRVRRRYRVLPYLTLLVIVISLLVLCNFPLFAYIFNLGAYVKQSVQVVSEGYDGIISLIPKITVSYSYNNVDYEQSFLDYNTWLFHNDNNFEEVYVNTSSPSNILFIHSFWSSYVNIVLVFIIVVCVVIIVNNIKRRIPKDVKEKYREKFIKFKEKITKKD